MKNVIIPAILTAALLAASAAPAKAPTELLEDAYETSDLRVTLRPDMTGFVRFRPCGEDEQCSMLEFRITPQTKAIDGGQEVPLETIRDWQGHEAMVGVDIADHRTVLRIINFGRVPE